MGGLSLAATAWSTTGKLQNAGLEIHRGQGTGACNRIKGTNCSTTGNAHGLDNNNGADLILFIFSNTVKFDSLDFSQPGSDLDFGLWAETGPIYTGKLRLISLGGVRLISHNDHANTNKTLTLNHVLDGCYDWLAVSIRSSQENNGAILRGLRVNPVSLQVPQPVVQSVPEAGTWAMLLAGLGLVGFAAYRKARFKSLHLSSIIPP